MKRLVLSVAGMMMLSGSFGEPLQDGGPYKETVDGIEWTFSLSDGKAILENCVSDAFLPVVPTETTGAIVIPVALGGCPVVSIGNGAFAGMSELTSVQIPSTVTNIGESAFSNCEKIWALTVPESVKSVGIKAFNLCGDSIVRDGIGCGKDEFRSWLVFEGAPPDHVRLAMKWSLADWGVFVGIRYNKTYEKEWLIFFESASYWLFGESYWPYETEVVNGIEWCFRTWKSEAILCGDSTICRAAIPTSTVGKVDVPSVLGGCPVTSVGESAFLECGALAAVTIPASVTNIVGGAFAGCHSLSDVYFEGVVPPRCQSSYALFGDCQPDLIVHVPREWTGRSPVYCGCHVEKAGGSDAGSLVNVTVTNIVVQYVLNSVQPNIAVPVSPDTGFVTVITEVKSSGAVSIPSEWATNYPSFFSRYDTDFGKALMMKSGKKNGAGNDMFVWQDFVAGTDPTNPKDKFTASITLVDGVPVVSYTPELAEEQKALRIYKTIGKKQLQDEKWDDLTNVDDAGKKAYNFFKVTVEMR